MSPTSPSTTHASVLPSSKTIDILHIEDDQSFADLVATFLERERENFAVHTETVPRDALTTLQDGDITFDCIVSDYDMPGLNGLEVLQHVREENPNLPFILFTGKGSEEIASEAITAGVTEYLQKGGGTEQYQVLANRIQNAVEHYWAERYLNRGLEAIETAHDGIAILNKDGYIEYLNSAYAELLGYERDELIDVHWETLYHDEDVDEIYDLLLPAAKDGRWHGQTSFVRKDSTRIDLEHTLSFTDDGSLICTLSNLTTDESVETELSMRERAMNEAPVGIILTNPHAEDNPIIYANDEFTDLTGYEKDEVLGRNCRFLQGEQTREEPVAELRNAVEKRESVTVELRNYRADGTEFWNRVRIAPLFDDNGDIEYFVGFQDDVTGKKTQEEQLRSQTARLEALFEHSPDMIAIHDANGIICDVNQRLCDELGYTEDEVIGKHVWELDISSDPDRARSFWNDLPTNTPQRFEGKLERKGGTTVPVEVHLIRLDLDGKDRFVGMDRDITEQKQQQRELIEQNERLNRFTSIVSHDLRNPIQLAQGRLELLQEECDSAHIADIENALRRMDALTDDLLTLARVGDEAMETEGVVLDEILRESWGTVATKDATLTVETDRMVAADRDQLKQLFENLFRNAVEHADENITVTIGETADGFYVEDNGPGISESEYDEIFEVGYTTVENGTGFGLNIVSRIVDAHGWTITITEGSEGGARFEISL
ncbi:PAS domain S-box protein [Natrinema versiforme]|uniref:histidine kinase n=1 Tax=Natrinema versiforme JCM 10478 TaxID=1227496 RepID=L9XNH7_9EURY|nr:PAS domain S-box protein [Natrinema versiforme]ELY63349.1 HTR-like protein [Natrinema versiforme JCM 10478]